MSKDEWLQIRDKQDIDISVFFDYYREKGGYLTNFQDFQQQFVKLGLTHTLLRNGRMMKLDYATAVKRLYDYYNGKFDT